MRLAVVLGAALLSVACAAHAEDDARTVSELTVIAPLPGTGIDADKLPAATATLDADDLSRTGSLSITAALEQRIPGLSLSDVQGNALARDVNYRGFQASPINGSPQGLAVYLGGVRLNEAFGDTVNWDLIPDVAIARADLVTGNPAFGLNALGGALSLGMKTGRTAAGGTASAEGGSFGRSQGSVEYGGSSGAWSGYLAIDGGRDGGWRRQSKSSVGRLYGDLGWRAAAADLHLVVAAGRSDLGVVGPTPADILSNDRRAVYTYPQTTKDESRLLALSGAFTLSPDWTLQADLNGRTFRQGHLDGNDGNFEGCTRTATNPLFGTLCLEDDAFPAAIRPPAAAFQVQGLDGRPVGCPPLVAGQNRLCNGIPYGSLDRTRTRAQTRGASLQATRTAPLFGRTNLFVAGLSLDRGRARFSADSTLAMILPSLEVSTTSTIPGVGQVIRTASAVAYTPVSINATTGYDGLYATDTLDLTPNLFLTVSGRFNVARIETRDRTGSSPDLNGSHRFSRFNPAAGLAWKVGDRVTAYGGYAETNRAPTPLELACSDPLRPCLLENALVADPPLKQVTARTWQAGVRGGAGGLDWSLGLFQTDNRDDVLALASAIQGRGYYANVPATRRRGLEASVAYRSDRWMAYASASTLEATYRFAGSLPSPNSPFADAAGNVSVSPGDHLGGIPAQGAKAGADFEPLPGLKFGGDLVAVGAQRLLGDENGQGDRLKAYVVAGVHANWAVGHGLELFVRVDNLFDRRYATFGSYFETSALDNLKPSPLPADPDPRTFTPAPPRSFMLGLRTRW